MTSSNSNTDTEGTTKRTLRKWRYDSLEEIRSIYRAATKAFLLNHHRQVWHSLSLGLNRIHSLLIIPTTAPLELEATTTTLWWLNTPTTLSSSASIDSTIDLQLHQLARKFHILRITFLTAILQNSPLVLSLIRPSSSSPLPDDPSSEQLSQEQLVQLTSFLTLNRQPDLFLRRLLITIIPNDQLREPGRDDAHPTADELLQIHPSILTAIGLASIKLGVPETGKELIERWFSAVQSLNLCFVLHPKPSLQNSSPQLGLSSDLRICYQNLIQIYAIHILGPLDLWPFAIDFINSHQSADILPIETVQNIIHAIKTARLQQEQLVKHNKQRQQQRREEKKERQGATQQQQQNKGEPGRAIAGGRSTASKSTDPASGAVATRMTKPNGSVQLVAEEHPSSHPVSVPSVPSSSSSGFAGLRNHLARFVAADHHHRPSSGLGPMAHSPTNPGTLAQLKLSLSSLLRLPHSSTANNNSLFLLRLRSLKRFGAFLLLLLCFLLRAWFPRSSAVNYPRLSSLLSLAKLVHSKITQVARMAQPDLL
ncbi:hypothetical protein VP01_2074g2 [Puccinia sorghi]|uniref:Uncharacterized protein n=1 Tax=Puccinia sorghi TaxID=27349 RepID=A0A0L6VCA8_9BASI|nr:hypothetical protein VP01_2074g2 [Puccinia sorghi]